MRAPVDGREQAAIRPTLSLLGTLRKAFKFRQVVSLLQIQRQDLQPWQETFNVEMLDGPFSARLKQRSALLQVGREDESSCPQPSSLHSASSVPFLFFPFTLPLWLLAALLLQ